MPHRHRMLIDGVLCWPRRILASPGKIRRTAAGMAEEVFQNVRLKGFPRTIPDTWACLPRRCLRFVSVTARRSFRSQGVFNRTPRIQRARQLIVR